MKSRSRRRLELALCTMTALILSSLAASAFVLSTMRPLTLPANDFEVLAKRTVYDRPLLDEFERAEARATGYASFNCGGVHYVVEHIPEQYL